MESESRKISLPLTTEQNPEIVVQNKLRLSPGIIQTPSEGFPLKERLKLKNCGLPEEVLQSYSHKGIDTSSWNVSLYLKY